MGRSHGVEVFTDWTHTSAETRRRGDEMGIARIIDEQDFKTDVRRDVAGFRSKANEAVKEAEMLASQAQSEEAG